MLRVREEENCANSANWRCFSLVPIKFLARLILTFSSLTNFWPTSWICGGSWTDTEGGIEGGGVDVEEGVSLGTGVVLLVVAVPFVEGTFGFSSDLSGGGGAGSVLSTGVLGVWSLLEMMAGSE